MAATTALLGGILARTAGITTAIEFGSNIGLKPIALRRLLKRKPRQAATARAANADERVRDRIRP